MIDFTNYREHPERKKFLVYHFYREAQADYFEGLLKDHDIWYERANEEEEEKAIYFFGIRKDDKGKVERLNNLAIGKFRDRFIPYRWLRWITVLVSIVILGLAIAGFLLDR